MQTLEQTALTFARECLGWADVKLIYSQDQPEKPRFVVCSPNAGQDTLFAPADWLDTKAVATRWCTDRDMGFTIANAQGVATATITRTDGDGEPIQVSNGSVCQALLEACIQVQRGTSE